jgi:hypothetical protein
LNFARRAAGLSLTILATAAGCGGDRAGGVAPPQDPTAGVVLTATTEPVPYTVAYVLSLIAPDRVCMVDSYETQVICGGPTWSDVQRFGRGGEGPGEYGAIVGIARLPEGRLGVVDHALQRLTIVTSRLEVEGTTPFAGNPSLVRTAGDSTVAVTTLGFEAWIPRLDHARRRTRVDWVLPGQGVARTQTLSLPDTVPVGRAPLFAGTWALSRGFVFLRMPYEIVRFSPEGEYLGRFTPTHYEPELPNLRDVEHRAEGMRYVFGYSPSPADLEGFAAEPKHGILGGMGVVFSSDGLLWIGTTRDRDRWSYIDVYAGREELKFFGSVQVRDRMLAFDVLDGTLAVLVERQDADRHGLRPYAIDWYDTTEWAENRRLDFEPGGGGS